MVTDFANMTRTYEDYSNAWCPRTRPYPRRDRALSCPFLYSLTRFDHVDSAIHYGARLTEAAYLVRLG